MIFPGRAERSPQLWLAGGFARPQRNALILPGETLDDATRRWAAWRVAIGRLSVLARCWKDTVASPRAPQHRGPRKRNQPRCVGRQSVQGWRAEL